MGDFLWLGLGESRRDHLVNWEVCCIPKMEGGRVMVIWCPRTRHWLFPLYCLVQVWVRGMLFAILVNMWYAEGILSWYTMIWLWRTFFGLMLQLQVVIICWAAMCVVVLKRKGVWVLEIWCLKILSWQLNSYGIFLLSCYPYGICWFEVSMALIGTDGMLIQLIMLLILSPWKFISQGYSTFKTLLCLKVGNGSPVDFWEDHWLGDSSFSVAFPHLYRSSSLRNPI